MIRHEGPLSESRHSNVCVKAWANLLDGRQASVRSPGSAYTSVCSAISSASLTGQTGSRRTRTPIRRYITCIRRIPDGVLLRGYYPGPGIATTCPTRPFIGAQSVSPPSMSLWSRLEMQELNE
jgi:hypothetical protein